MSERTRGVDHEIRSEPPCRGDVELPDRDSVVAKTFVSATSIRTSAPGRDRTFSEKPVELESRARDAIQLEPERLT